jgi:predicted short-subunit dehydrogenase-like oxidoreductase (DUF2520 family)
MRSRGRGPLIAIVGAGRVGSALGRALREKGWRFGPIVTRSMRSARVARRRIGSGAPQAGLSEAILGVEVVLIATPDREIRKTAEALARLRAPATSAKGKAQKSNGDRDNSWRRKIVLHTSGALASDVLAPLARRGASAGSLHPLQTFSGRAVPSLAGSVCAIEGSPAALRLARRICRDLRCIAVPVRPRDRAAYHGGAALVAGHILAVFEAAVCMLVTAGFSRPRAIRALLPLTRQTLANDEHAGPAAAWTGPLSRGDFGVIESHLEALRRFPREYREAYVALSRLGVRVLAAGSRAKRRALERAIARIK